MRHFNIPLATDGNVYADVPTYRRADVPTVIIAYTEILGTRAETLV